MALSSPRMIKHYSSSCMTSMYLPCVRGLGRVKSLNVYHIIARGSLLDHLLEIQLLSVRIEYKLSLPVDVISMITRETQFNEHSTVHNSKEAEYVLQKRWNHVAQESGPCPFAVTLFHSSNSI